jgi:hypothetical protein
MIPTLRGGSFVDQPLSPPNAFFLVAHRGRNTKDEAGLFCFRPCFWCITWTAETSIGRLAAPLYTTWVSVRPVGAIKSQAFKQIGPCLRPRARRASIFIVLSPTVRSSKLLDTSDVFCERWRCGG